jgi:hypothetical protein
MKELKTARRVVMGLSAKKVRSRETQSCIAWIVEVRGSRVLGGPIGIWEMFLSTIVMNLFLLRLR